jgi:galacturan 1,4-alpha-galacturonidase
MVQLLQTVGLFLSTAFVLVSAAPAPIPTAAPDLSDAAALHKRTSCTFTAAAAASKSKTSCATIVLDGITVPSGVTLDLTGLTEGTEVRRSADNFMSGRANSS